MKSISRCVIGNVTFAFIESVEDQSVLVGPEFTWRCEVLVIAGSFGNAHLVDESIEELRRLTLPAWIFPNHEWKLRLMELANRLTALNLTGDKQT